MCATLAKTPFVPTPSGSRRFPSFSVAQVKAGARSDAGRPHARRPDAQGTHPATLTAAATMSHLLTCGSFYVARLRTLMREGRHADERVADKRWLSGPARRRLGPLPAATRRSGPSSTRPSDAERKNWRPSFVRPFRAPRPSPAPAPSLIASIIAIILIAIIDTNSYHYRYHQYS